MRADGAFYQFTYGPRCPVRRSILERFGLKAVRIGGALANMPPASVYRIRRRPPVRASATGMLAHVHGGDGDTF
jgi:phospholipid N-methyltransferase